MVRTKRECNPWSMNEPSLQLCVLPSSKLHSVHAEDKVGEELVEPVMQFFQVSPVTQSR